ncbi:VOC family protein [Alteromonas sp. 14N.309.X.WAT.G.H12]|uniref:VOC family protein n=1 Tax=Alteromonas sp. 14N.309.X.WAT.G.H12 TaxID=3120824 RepID=UPI002FD441F0
MSQVVQQKIANIALMVKHYDEAIAFYTQKLQFTLVEDIPLDDDNRWVQISPPHANGTYLLLVRADTDEKRRAIGNQTGGAVFLILHTNDFWRDYHNMKEQGVTFDEVPREEPYGTVVVFQDLYGNKWDLLQPK